MTTTSQNLDVYDRAKPIMERMKNDPELMRFIALTAINFLDVVDETAALQAIAHESVDCLARRAVRKNPGAE